MEVDEKQTYFHISEVNESTKQHCLEFGVPDNWRLWCSSTI